MQRRLAAGAIERTPQNLAIDRDNPLNLRAKSRHEALKRGAELPRIELAEQSTEGIMAGQTVRQLEASQRVVANLLRELNYSCQANSKTREGGKHPDRDAQFAHINETVKAAIVAGEPAISVDTKKKELVGDFKNNGRELRPKGQPETVRVHDFKIPEQGKVAPMGSMTWRPITAGSASA
jgi:hypothetical protein